MCDRAREGRGGALAKGRWVLRGSLVGVVALKCRDETGLAR